MTNMYNKQKTGNKPFLAGLSTVWESAVGLGRLLNLDDRASGCTSPDGTVDNTNRLNHYKHLHIIHIHTS